MKNTKIIQINLKPIKNNFFNILVTKIFIKMSNDNIDYDKQFQADLEKAQALSLETLALEKYRMQKLYKQHNAIDSNRKSPETFSKPPVTEPDNKEPTRSDSFKLKSRPRPGTLNVVPTNSVIPPPPANQRRTSNAGATVVDGNVNDLISFASPPSGENKLMDFDDLNLLNNTVTVEKIDVNKKFNQLLITQPQVNYNVNQRQTYPFQNSVVPNIHTPPVLFPQISFPGYMTQPIQSRIPVQISPQQMTQQIFQQTPTIQNKPINTPSSQEPPPLPPKYSSSKPPPLPASSNSAKNDVLKALSKQDNNNLIDLTPSLSLDTTTHSRISVLEAFDPFCTPTPRPVPLAVASSQEHPGDDSYSVCSGSMYEEYDPFDYLYSGSGAASVSEPIYATINRGDKTPLSPPPLPPRQSHFTLERQKRQSQEDWSNKKIRLFENIKLSKRRASLIDCDLKGFYNLVKDVRIKFKYTDPETNSGMVISPRMQSQYKDETSIKLCIYAQTDNSNSESNSTPVTFTCDVSCSVEHVAFKVICELELPSSEKYFLKVWGLTEYLAPNTTLADYEYIHNCIKLEQDILLSLVPDSKVDRTFARTLQDDKRDEQIKISDLIPNEPVIPISYDHLLILLETIEKEMERIGKNVTTLGSETSKHSGVVQAVRAVCTFMGGLETQEISESLYGFVETCEKFINATPDEPYYQKPSILGEVIQSHCNQIRAAVQGLIEMYCHAFRVEFFIGNQESPNGPPISISEVTDWITVRVGALHRLPIDWKHDSYEIEAQVYHGTRRVGNFSNAVSLAITTGPQAMRKVMFDNDLYLDDVSYSMLARESRLVLVLNGFTVQPSDSNENSNEPRYVKEELGWAAFQFFNYEGVMTQGNMLLSLWPPEANKRIGPAPPPGSHPQVNHPVLSIELIAPSAVIHFPNSPRPTSPEVRGDFSSLDLNTQQLLLEIVDQDTLHNPPVDMREVLWEKRHYLYHLPNALPKVLLAAHSWDWTSLGNLHQMLYNWSPLPPLQALQLLLPCFPDMEVRRLAVTWIQHIQNDELVDYLPQLVQALKHETYETSPLVGFLLERAMCSPRVAHHLYWLLIHTLPGQCPQNSSWENNAQRDEDVCLARHFRRLQLVLRALLAVSGEALRNCLISQQLLVKNLYEIAEEVKQTKESLRLKVMTNSLDIAHQNLVENPNCLPLSPSLRVAGIQARTCSYFPSNTLPLKINFLALDGTVVPAIFKVGDDLQQDMLTLQMVRIMDKLWLKEGLDLKMVTFACVPTGHHRGMIEMVSNAETLRKIQVEWGLTGSFKDKPIAEWLAKHNPSELEYERARENFMASCAGYSVVTYILGICDRHNDNIMLKTSGHLFHIDFGKFLGDAQMFGNFKRDRAPFVLTSDMAFVINGSDRPSARFHKFVDLCCQAFNIVRANGNLILNLFTFMASSGIPGVTTEAVSYVKNALLPGKSNPEAAAMFARLIQSSLKSWFTQFNFFLHNLAQLRFTGDHGDEELLSFVPKIYNMQQEGRIIKVDVINFEKRYDPDKYYVYILRVEREGQPHSTNILRTYKEFCELHQKLCLHFPLAKIHSLPTGIHMGRSNIKQVAEKRLPDIQQFIITLFKTADEIAHSDLVYTFFHPMLRDQENIEVFKNAKGRRSEPNDIGRVKGQLKLTLHYQRDALSVMVHHARSLPLVAGGQEPSTYVKVYLQPDPTKCTKRKTKIVKRNCYPSFMEMLEYRMSLDVIKMRTLEASVWNNDPLQENEFLGGVCLDLSEFDLTQEITEWFSLTNLNRRSKNIPPKNPFVSSKERLLHFYCLLYFIAKEMKFTKNIFIGKEKN